MGEFADLAIDAEEMIAESGRQVVFRRNTGSTPVDSQKPWYGVNSVNSDVSIFVVFDAFKSHELKGTEVQSSDVKCYVASLELNGLEPKPGDLIIDNGQSMRVMKPVHWDPGVDSILFELHLRPS